MTDACTETIVQALEYERILNVFFVWKSSVVLVVVCHQDKQRIRIGLFVTHVGLWPKMGVSNLLLVI